MKHISLSEYLEHSTTVLIKWHKNLWINWYSSWTQMATISLCCYTQYIIRNRLRKANIGITTFVQDCTSHTQLNLKIILLQKEDDDIIWYPLHNKSICYIYKWRGGKCKSNVCLYTHAKWKNVSQFFENLKMKNVWAFLLSKYKLI